MRRTLLALVALVGLASVANAGDILVTYRVNYKLLRASTPAGTALLFQLYTGSTCATAAGAPQVVNVDAVTLIEAPKLVR